MVRIFGSRQNNRYYAQCLSRRIGTIRSVVSSSVRSETNGQRPNKKAPRFPSNNKGCCQREQRSRSDSSIKKTTQLPRGSGPREARLAEMALSQFEMVLRGEANLRLKFHTVASLRISRIACLGNREAFTHDDRLKANWWTTSWWEKSSRWTWNGEV